jgi:acyl-coenzyme A thioesterase PaaI-like protein
LLDEAMSKAVRAQGRFSMTRKMDVDYLRPVPSGAPLRIEGHIVRSERRKYWVEATILNAEGSVLAQAKGLFIEVKP